MLSLHVHVRSTLVNHTMCCVCVCHAMSLAHTCRLPVFEFLQEAECLNDVLMIPMALHTYLQLAAPLLETPASPCQGPGDEGNTIIIL